MKSEQRAMADENAPGVQPRRLAIMGWLLAVIFLVLFWNIIQMPRTALDQREFLHALHFSLGLIVSVLATVRLIWWFRGPTLRGPIGLPDGSFAFHRAVLFALVLTFAVESLIGFGYAWGTGHEVVLYGLQLPAMMSKSEPVRMSMGYLHSALAFYYMMLVTIWFGFGAYQHLRYGAGIARLFPGSRV
jgi:cytochrome b561